MHVWLLPQITFTIEFRYKSRRREATSWKSLLKSENESPHDPNSPKLLVFDPQDDARTKYVFCRRLRF